MNANVLTGAALRQPPLPQVAPEPKQLPIPGLDNRLIDGDKVVSLTHPPHFTRKKH
jgi:hypothetical protein